VDRAIVDGVVRAVDFKLLPDGTVTAKIPHFWVNSGIIFYSEGEGGARRGY
jgi:hypothetical protein